MSEERAPFPTTLKIAKVWQSHDHQLIFQVSVWGALSKKIAAKKLFLVTDVRQASFGITVVDKKPEFQALTTNPMITLLRKYCKTGVITNIFKDNNNGDLWLPLHLSRSSNPEWYLLLNKSRPPEMALVKETNDIYVRHGIKGSFTKKRSYEGKLPYLRQDDFSDRLEELLEEHTRDPKEDAPDTDSPEVNEETGDANAPQMDQSQRELLGKLKRRLKTAKKAHENQLQKLPSEADMQEQIQKARLLQTYAYLVKEGQDEITLEAEQTGLDQAIVIALDPDISKGANIELYFKQAKKLQKGRELGLTRMKKQDKQLETLQDDVERLTNEAVALSDLASIASRHKINFSGQEQQKSQPKSIQKLHSQAQASPYRSYQSSTGHWILVGKGPKENDELTKSASSKDLWIHAAGVAGSHVIVPVKGDLKAGVPPQLIKEAAILAIHYSKFRDDLAGEAYVANKAQIKKQKGMPPGLWNVERCKTMFFRYSKDELQDMLNRLV